MSCSATRHPYPTLTHPHAAPDCHPGKTPMHRPSAHHPNRRGDTPVRTARCVQVEAFKPISISEEGTPRGTLLARAGVVGFGAVLAGFVKVYSLWAKGRVVNVGSGGIDSLIKANTARAAGFGGNADISGYLGGHVADVRAPYNPMMGATGGVFGGGSSTDFSDATLFAEVKQAQLEEKQRRERREARLREMADMRERGEEVDEEELRQARGGGVVCEWGLREEGWRGGA